MAGVALAAGQGLADVQSYAEQLSQQRLFAGMLHVEQGGRTVLSKGFGLANLELGVPMRNDHRYEWSASPTSLAVAQC